ncbi:MAG: 50S ribosomal protein L13 [bacterium]|nr:50S ribosomal protein L13 [bacterium]MDZ4295883.1 50S ribosomal protein L13 [Patescibacteria group bacterium]
MSKVHTIDATGKVLGRLATEAARLLRGKDEATFAPERLHMARVVIFNTGRITVTGRKLKQKIYFRHSTYPGGAKYTPLERIFERNPNEVLRKAVSGMLPKNKLRPLMLKHLELYRGNLPGN